MDKNVENVVSQLRDREQRGLSKYGVNTERTDLSTLEWLQHLQEELMDGAVYIENKLLSLLFKPFIKSIKPQPWIQRSPFKKQ